MMFFRFFLRWIAPSTMIAVTAAGAQEVKCSSMDLVSRRAVVYARGTWTVAYVPEAKFGRQVPYGREYHVLAPDGWYKLKTDSRKSIYCFLVSHRSFQYGGQESYLGVAAFSILKERTNPAQPVSMFRNQGWRRSDDSTFGNANAIKQSELHPHQFFSVHVRPESLTALDTDLGYKWHGQYGENEKQHSWKDHVLWNLSNDLNEVVSDWFIDLNKGQIKNFDISDLMDTRFDGKLIRFIFTKTRDSNKPPRFCLRSDSRLVTAVTLFSPHLAGTLNFTIDFQ